MVRIDTVVNAFAPAQLRPPHPTEPSLSPARKAFYAGHVSTRPIRTHSAALGYPARMGHSDSIETFSGESDVTSRRRHSLKARASKAGLSTTRCIAKASIRPTAFGRARRRG
jgi:hypothetical protein